MSDLQATDVLKFWLSAGLDRWFTKSDEFDQEIREKFEKHVEAARRGDYDAWTEQPIGTAALIIMLDQFSRNIYRNSPDAFAGDEKALLLAKSLVDAKIDMELPVNVRQWIYMPYEHAEDLDDQQTCVILFRRSGFDDLVPYAEEHRDIIARFGRFPHRNAVLGRESSQEEIDFLDGGGFKG